MSHNKLDQILFELYKADPSLRQHDQVLRKLVMDIIALKPQVEIDEAFRLQLKSRLNQIATNSEQEQSLITNFMNSFKWVGSGAVMATLLLVGAWYFVNNKDGANNFMAMSNKLNISRSSENAFGSLAKLQQAGGQGGGNANSVAANSESSAVINPAPNDDKMMIAPENPVNYRYVYNGEPLVLNQTQLDVLKRQKNQNSGGLSEFINRITFGLVNFGSFSNTQLESFTFKEDKDLGYMINVSVSEGTVNIHENWSRWEALTMPAGRKINISEVPADNVLIDAANAFLTTHGIDKDVYGAPSLNNDWRVFYDSTPNKADYWIPEVMNVIYPLNINGQLVYDESGNPTGLNVGVRISPEVRVTGVWDLTVQNYQASAYESETDVNRIMALVERGGFRNYYYFEQAQKTIDVEVGAPDISYVKLWNYDKGLNEELLVPALVFPIISQPNQPHESYWHRKNIVIPLVKEILDNEPQIIDDLPVRIMPAESGQDQTDDVVQPTEPALMKENE